MKSKTHVLLFVFLAFFIQGIVAQNSQNPTNEKIKQAISLMDKGQIDASIEILNQVLKEDPKNDHANYELGYALYSKQDYKAAIKVLKKLTKADNPGPLVYQLLGNSYDMAGDANTAIATYEKGLAKYPEAGNLYLESGVMQAKKQDLDKALSLFEEGIKAAPAFASNYFHAANFFCNSNQSVWGMLYGELFLNLEPNTSRSKMISKLLYDTYAKNIQFSDSKIGVNFSPNIPVNREALLAGKTFAIPFGPAIYEETIGRAIFLGGADRKITEINLTTLDTLRTRFVDLYFGGENPNSARFPNVLFEYQKKIKDAGHFDAYNHWILMFGDEIAFAKWYEENQKKFDEFAKWQQQNRLTLDNDHKFYRAQYNL